MPHGSLYAQVRSVRHLWRAWRHVRARGKASSSWQTRNEVREFDQEADSKLRSISSRLSHRSFRFKPGVGILKKRSGKRARTIFIAPVEGRVVQRAILDAIKSDSRLATLHGSTTSFGMRGVPLALAEVHEITTTPSGLAYIRSDIADFFTRVPRHEAIGEISTLVEDDDFRELLDKATKVDLANSDSLGDERYRFPDDEHGVAQGGSLSALIGDIVLREFDREMNGRGVHCIRYVDDFVILGPKPRSVRRAFDHAQDILGKLGLRAYDPDTESEKAVRGWTNRPWEFLGCELLPGIIRPSRAAKRHLLETVEATLRKSSASMAHPPRVAERGDSFAETIAAISRLLRGWGNQYQFCNDYTGMDNLDGQIGRLVQKYELRVLERSSGLSPSDRQRLLGVHLLRDSTRKPIIAGTSRP